MIQNTFNIKKVINFLIINTLLALGACSTDSSTSDTVTEKLFESISSAESGINFENIIEDDSAFNILTYRNKYNGGGVAIGDINNDNLPDVFLVSNMGKSKLYQNLGNWKFKDITETSKLKTRNDWTTGVAMADVNGDGFLDVYICHSGDVKGQSRENELFINDGKGTFAEMAKSYGLNDAGFTTHASFFDYDLDGDLDCFVLNNSFKDVSKFNELAEKREIPDALGGEQFYKNENGKFRNVSQEVGIFSGKIGFGLGISVGDVNGDMYPDMYVSNDFFEKDYLYINQKNGKGSSAGFKETIASSIGHTSTSSMGSDMGDINNDGLMDIFTTDMLPNDDYRLKVNTKFDEYNVRAMKKDYDFHNQFIQNCLQLNNGNQSFSEIGFYAGVGATDWSWGALMFDFQNDGWKDIFVSNGIYRDITSMDFVEFLGEKSNIDEMIQKKGRFDFRDFLPSMESKPISNYAFINNKNLKFADEANNLGLGEPNFSNGAAYGDLDNDGDLDLIVNTLNGKALVYKNLTQEKLKPNFLRLKLSGKKGNNFGVGTRITCYAQGQQQVLQQMPNRGFESSVDPILIFGLGQIQKIDSLEIVWATLEKQVLYDVKPNQTLQLKQSEALGHFSPKVTKEDFLFENVTSTILNTPIIHKENFYIDFNDERLRTQMLSTQGPKMAIGDLNGDNLDDVYICGARNDLGKLLIQAKDGKFNLSEQPDFKEDSFFEDTDAAIFDVDKDGDNDLVVCSGGNEPLIQSIGYATRVYLNDGKGKLKTDVTRSPQRPINASCIRPCDFDHDGDIDIFIGARAVPGKYGLSPESMLLQNDKGFFTEITSKELSKIGMVTDAVWQDLNNDKLEDLVIVGEWMPVVMLQNNGTNLVSPYGVEGTKGWWNVIKSKDIDGDGDIDFVLGNWGQNSKLRASTEQPLELIVGDFDNNQTIDPIMTMFMPDGISYPFASKGDLTAQIPFVKKKLVHYKDYANKTLDQILEKDLLKNVIFRKTETFASGILFNTGGKFEFRPFPAQAQFAPIFTIEISDFDADGIDDIFLAGNFFDLKPEIGRLDASQTVVLRGKGKGNFEYLANSRHGLSEKGQIRSSKIINSLTKEQNIFLGLNNDSIKVYSIKKK